MESRRAVQPRQSASASGTQRLYAPSIARLIERPEPLRRLGPFVLVEQLGRGGFAPVWLAREVYGDTTLRTAAVKLFALPQTGGAARRERERIIAEARALCRVEHPNVVRFYALPLDEEGGVMGLAMEHVAGTAVDRRLRKVERFGADETLALGTAIASALSAVHRAGLVHRDVKPSNIIETSGGYKLIDFGIAGADDADGAASEAEPASSEHTQRVALHVGTVGYIDPECVNGLALAEASSDLYSLGATLFECLTGRLPASSDTGLRVDVLDGRSPAPRLAEIAPDVPPALAELVDALLAPKRENRPASAEWVAIRLEQIRRELGGAPRRLPPERVGPFRGLGRFEGDDRDIYYGRTAETAAVLETLRGRGLAALLGPSGSGKSSLARAAVLPAVADGALGAWPPAWDVIVTEPGRDPRAAVCDALAAVVPDAHELSPTTLIARLAERAHASGRGTLLFVDQLEELATLSTPESALFVVELLAGIGERALPGVRAIVAARRDLLDPLLGLTELGKAVLRGSILVEPLADSVWAEVVDRALAAYGYTFEDAALRSEVLEELGRASGAMPLIQFALSELWSKRDVRKRKLTREGLHAIGGIAGALERHADAALAQVLAATGIPAEAPKALLLALTTSQGTRATRSRAELERLVGPAAGPILAILEARRLVEQHAGGITLTHEALISSWTQLRDWLAEERDQRLLAEEIERAAQAWSSASNPALLWRKQRLEAAERVASQASLGLSDEAVAFLRASRREERRRRLVTAAAATLVFGTAVSIAFAYLAAVRSEQEKTKAALAQEQMTRRLAERRTREVQEAQARIDELLKRIPSDSELKRDVMALQKVINDPSAPAPERRPRVSRGSALPQPSPAPEPSTAPAPTVTSSPSGIKLQREW